MGLYIHPNDMFKSDTLCHSDTYLGEDYTDGIKHWKYYKREKLSNGKYRYYYYQDKTNVTYTSDSKKDDKWRGNIGKYAKYTHVDQYGNKNTIQRKKGNGLITGHRVTIVGDGNSTEIYYDSKLERAIDRGKNKVNKLLKKVGKKLKKYTKGIVN